jgi:hypothetical protein
MMPPLSTMTTAMMLRQPGMEVRSPASLLCMTLHALTCRRADQSEVPLRSAGQDDGAAAQQEPASAGDDFFDPWAPLDMHDPGTLLVRPFRKVSRRTSRIWSRIHYLEVVF